MIKEAIYHKINSNYSYAPSPEFLTVVFRVAKNDMYCVRVHYYNRFAEKDIKSQEMECLISDSLFDYYRANLKLHGSSCVYYFEITDKKGVKEYFSELGFSDLPPERIGSYEMLPMHKTEINHVPEWVTKSVFYQIFPDRFCATNRKILEDIVLATKSKAGLKISTWGEEPTFTSIFGGNLKGIISKLDYLKELNISAIYLTPIFKSDSCHRYDTQDYYAIDEIVGTQEELVELVDKCHAAKIKVMLDGVFNHCSDKFFAFEDVKKNGLNSKYIDWFYIEKLPIVNNGCKEYLTFGNEQNMPKLNTENPEVIEYFLKVVEYWTKKTNLDGWRLDVADEVSSTFWRQFRSRIKSINPDIFILGEVWHNGEYYFHNKFDSTMNYLFYQTVTKDMFEDVDIFKDKITKLYLMYPREIVFAEFNLIDSHDTMRVLSRVGSEDKMYQAVVFQHCYVGIPCVYYGDEIGLVGGNDPQNRRCMTWNNINKKRHDFYKNIIGIRQKYDCLSSGEFGWLSENAGEKCIAFYRRKDDSQINIYINTSNKAVKIDINGEFLISNLCDNGGNLAPDGFAVILK